DTTFSRRARSPPPCSAATGDREESWRSCRRVSPMPWRRLPRSSGCGSARGTTGAGVEVMAIAEKKSTSVDSVLADWKQRGIRNVRFELPDMPGTSLSKIVPIEHAARFAKDGLNMYGGAAVLDSRSDVVPGTLYNEEVAYADQLLHPDVSTAAVLPWVEATGRFICDATWADGRPLAASPRHVFNRVLERTRALGYEPVMGMESEFYLLDPETHKPIFDGYHIFNSVRNTWVPAIERIVSEMRELGVDIITANCEYAGAQWEINYA